jgi:tubulin polyglutamylase TTLL4
MARETAEKNKLWIMKPTNQACGRGIKMVTKDSTVKNKKDILVS